MVINVLTTKRELAKPYCDSANILREPDIPPCTPQFAYAMRNYYSFELFDLSFLFEHPGRKVEQVSTRQLTPARHHAGDYGTCQKPEKLGKNREPPKRKRTAKQFIML